MHHISRDAELAVLNRAAGPAPGSELPRVTRTQVFEARTVIGREVAVSPAIKESLVDIARATRRDDRILQGASTRSLVLAMPALQARAALKGRDFVASEDIEHLVPHLFAHRLELAPGVTDTGEVLRAASAEPIERLARLTLRPRVR